MTMVSAPERAETAEYYHRYIDQVPAGDIRDVLEHQLGDASSMLEAISEEQSLHRYAPGKWSIREVVAHINDTERLFTFRAFWFARALGEPLPSFDQDIAASHAGADDRPWRSHLDEFRAVRAATIARERSVPYFGICYGFQWATVEYARNVCGIADADSTECAPDTANKVIYKLRDLLGVDDLGGTMRLGSYACELTPGSLAQRVYGATLIHERHRHRYEFNCLYERTLTDAGLEIVGRSHDGKFVEIVELPSHPWYVAVQFHPEFKSKPLKPHPLFAGFVEASHRHKLAKQQPAAASVVG